MTGGKLAIRKGFFTNRENLFLVFFRIGKEEQCDVYLIPAKSNTDRPTSATLEEAHRENHGLLP